MKDFFKNSFKTTNNSIIVGLPMILFALCMQSYFESVQKFIYQFPQCIVALVTFWVLISGFCAGWFYMIKRAISFSDKIFVYDKDRNQALREVFGGFFKGFGKMFLPFLIVVAGAIGIRVIEYNIINFAIPALDNKISYEIAMLFIFVIISCISYWFIFWIPEIIYGNRNPFKALVNSTKKAFITFPKTIKLFLVMWLIFLGMNILFQLLLLNPFLYFFAMLLNYYLILYTAILIFDYYEQNFIR